MVLVDADSPDELAEARDFITAQGGTVAIILPPRALFGWVSRDVESRILGRKKIRSVHRSVVDAGSVAFRDRDTQLAVRIFNDIASGESARRARREAQAATVERDARSPMVDCALPRPAIDKSAFIRNLSRMGAERSLRDLQSRIEPSFLDGSNVMDGSVAVGIFLIESNGGIDPNVYSWSVADQDLAVTKLVEGLTWWVDQSRAFPLSRPLQFIPVIYRADTAACQQPYEPILHQGRDSSLWVNKIMENLGATEGDVFARVAAFNRRIRDENRANWAYSVFVAYNPDPAPTSYTDGRASWAYLGGPHTNMLFRSYGWPLHQLISHETGHIFYACDEYNQPGHQVCSCSCAPEVRPTALNGNCENPSCNLNAIPCMMRVNEFALCQYTVAQIGWIEQTAPPPLPPTAPQDLVATASSPTEVKLIWQDTSGSEDGFEIQRRGGSTGEFTQLVIVNRDATEYTDFSALPNTTYAYRVRAFNTTAQSGFSNEVAVTTPITSSSLSVTTTNMPGATVGVAYSHNLSAVGGKPTANPDYKWLIESGSLPEGLQLSQTGQISGTPTGAGTSNFVARVTDAENNSAARPLSLTVRPAAPLTITTRELPRGAVGIIYSQPLGASGGQTPYNWSLQSGNLPDGVTLNQATGILSGTPERAGTSSFVIRLTDATNTGVTATLSLTVNPPVLQLSVDAQDLPDGITGEPYSYTLKAAGGTGPRRWAITSGALPDGLEMSEAGVITGTPTRPGDFTFQAQVSDQSGQSAGRQLSIEVEPPPDFAILTPAALPLAVIGAPYTLELRAAAGTAPYTWKKKNKPKFGRLPDGISLSSDGRLTGTPTAQGVYQFTLHVNDAAGKRASRAFTLEVGPPPPPLEIRTMALPIALQGIPYTAALEAAGGVAPYTWAVEGGILPDGLTMTSAGVISGRPTTIGAVNFTLRLRDAVGTSTTKSFFIIINPPPPPLAIQTAQLPEAFAERPYSQTLQAVGGVLPYTWGLASGSLPAGLSLSNDGVISGVSTTHGTSVFVARVTDSAQQSVTRTLAIIVKPADRVAPFGNLETPAPFVTLNTTAKGSGWALDNIGVAKVEVLVDGNKVADAIYGLSRPDIAVTWGTFPNGSHAGFSFTFDTTKLSNGEHRLSVRLLDAAGNVTVIGTRSIQVQNQVLLITSTDLPRGKVGEAYSRQLTAVNGKPPYSWSVASGTLPLGISLNAAGLISGTPTRDGTFPFSVRVTDSLGSTARASLALSINPDVEPMRILSSGDQSPGKVAVPYSQQLFFTGGRPPRTWSVGTGTLPPGLTLHPTDGVISGDPTEPGTFTFTVRLTDATPTTVTSEPLRIAIAPAPLQITSSGDLTTGAVGVVYAHQLTHFGGQGTRSWSLASGSLPPGLTLNGSTGRITGTPTTVGVSSFTVRLTDSTGTVTSDELRIQVVERLQITSSGDLTPGQAGVAYSH
ncbi:MAG TPA: putative Ig domain-containing protein, partial [Blastocatellia bacterium]|nr:putative Ig domain-containing protein [Blastocatellia bacterium]